MFEGQKSCNLTGGCQPSPIDRQSRYKHSWQVRRSARVRQKARTYILPFASGPVVLLSRRRKIAHCPDRPRKRRRWPSAVAGTEKDGPRGLMKHTHRS